MTDKCTIPDCKNDCFGDHKECVLHCDKGTYQDDKRENVLSVFYDELIEYILDIAKTDLICRDFIKTILTGKSVDKEIAQQKK